METTFKPSTLRNPNKARVYTLEFANGKSKRMISTDNRVSISAATFAKDMKTTVTKITDQ